MDTINLKGPHIGFRGEYRAVLRNEDGSVAYDSGWKRNLITTNGEFLYASRVGGSAWSSQCYIGSSAAPPAINDTTMGSFLAKQGNPELRDPASNSYNFGATTYQRWVTHTYRFGAGVGTGTVREMGMGNNEVTDYLFSHHLLDTPIVKASNQSLDVSYRFTIWPSLIETEANPILIGGVNYKCLTSFYNATNTGGSTFVEYLVDSAGGKTYDGVKAALTDATPAGNVGTGGSVTSMNTKGTGVSNVSTFYGLSAGVTATDIVKTAVFSMQNFFAIQTEFEALDGGDIGGGIPKDAEHELTLNWQITWGDKP